MKTGSWTRGEIILAVVMGCLAVGCIIPILGLQVTLAMKVGHLLAFTMASMVIGGLAVRIAGAFGVTLHGPRSALGIQMVFNAGDIAASMVVFTVPAFFVSSYEIMAPMPSLPFLTVVLLAGILAGVGTSLLIGAAGLDAPERGEIWPEVRAFVRAAQSFFVGWKNWVMLGLGACVSMFHDGFTELLGFARGGAGAEPFGQRGPWIGLVPTPALLAIGYLAGPWTGVTLLSTLIAGHWILVPIIGLIWHAAAGPTAEWLPSIRDVYRSMGMGVLIGAAPGYLLWALVRTFKKKKGDDPPAPDAFARRSAIVAIPVLLAALLVTASLLVVKGGLVSGLLGTAMVVILVPLGAIALVRGLASVGIAPMTGLTTVSILLASWVPRFSSTLDTTSLLLAIASIILVAAGVASMHATSMRAAAMLQFPKLPVAILVPILVVASSVVALVIVHALTGRSLDAGYGDMPMPYAFLFSGAARMAIMDGPHGIGLIIVGAVLGLGLSLARLPAMTVGIGLYLPPGMVFTLALGGLLRFIRRKSDDAQAGALSAGLIVGGLPIAMLVAAASLAELDITSIGHDALGGIVDKGWLALPTFLLSVLLLAGVAVWARLSTAPAENEKSD